MKTVSVLASLALVLSVAACDRDERLVQQHKSAAVEKEMPGKPDAKLPALPGDQGVPSSSQQSK